MFLKFYKPHVLLDPLISSIMIFAEQFNKNAPLTPIPFPPLPEQSLFFYPRSPISATIHETNNTLLKPTSIFVGPQIKRVNLILGHNHVVIRVGFKPGGLYRLLQLPMYEVVDNAFNSADFFPQEIKQINEQLFNTNSFDEMASIIQSFLLTKLSNLKPITPFDNAMMVLIQSRTSLSIEHIASIACISIRQFERQCKERVGMPPKLFARIARFSNAYRLFEASQTLSWTEIAHRCNYYDQMHFIKDCKEFAGVIPTVIAKEVIKAPAQLQYMLKL
ncbi:MAG: AraC family transcriptional regulator [Bacteroidetes bacterium]|nr:AraC family transcriptional regulator [Bacteroidota bacterium]